MEIELVPDPGRDDFAARAALAALAREGLAEERVPSGTTSAWRRAGLEDAMDRDLSSDGGPPGRGPAKGRPPASA
jgi:hypothetical protein